MIYVIDTFTQDFLDWINIIVPARNKYRQIDNDDIVGSGTEYDKETNTDESEDLSNTFESTVRVDYSPPRTQRNLTETSKAAQSNSIITSSNFADDDMLLRWYNIKNLPQPTLPETRNDILMGALKLKTGIDLDTLEVIYNPFRRKIIATWSPIPEVMSASCIFQHILANPGVFSYSITSTVQASLDQQYADPASLNESQEFDLPSGVMVETSLIDPQALTAMEDPLTFTNTEVKRDMCLDIVTVSFFLKIVSGKKTPNTKWFSRNRTMNGGKRQDTARNHFSTFDNFQWKKIRLNGKNLT